MMTGLVIMTRTSRLERISFAFFSIGMLCYLVLGHPLLTNLGLPYILEGGSFPAKIHAGSYFCVTAYLLLLFRDGNPLVGFIRQSRAYSLLMSYFVTTMFALLYSTVRYGPGGSAFVIDSLIMPAVCGLVVLDYHSVAQRRLLYLIFGVVYFNAAIAIGESLMQTHLIHYTIAGLSVTEPQFRATSLLGHPLNNGLVTAPIAIITLALRIPALYKAFLWSLLYLGLLAFGGRTAFVLVTLISACMIAGSTLKKLVTGQFGYIQVVGAAAALLVATICLLGIIFGTQIGERIILNLAWDDSAEMRRYLWTILDYVSAEEIFFGISPAELTDLTARLDYRAKWILHEAKIENFWLKMLLQFGAFGMFFIILGGFMSVLFHWRRTDWTARIALLLFFLIASSFNSLAEKTSAMSILYVCLIAWKSYCDLQRSQSTETIWHENIAGGRTVGLAPVFR